MRTCQCGNKTTSFYCKDCNAKRAREWRKKNPRYKPSGKIAKYPKEERELISAIRFRLKDAKSRCVKFGKSAPTVTADKLYQIFINQNRKCALTGVTLTIEQGPLTLSLDQIDPSKGYTVDNVQWLAWCVNRAKGDLSSQNFYDMCEAVIAFKNVQRLSNGSNS